MLNANSLSGRRDALPVRPIVLLAIANQQERAVHAYVLSAAGFDVVLPDASAWDSSTLRPDIVLIDLMDRGDQNGRSSASALRDVPIVALVPDVGRASCERARDAGCTAVCLSTCSAEVLAAGLRAVLERSSGQTGRVHDE